MQDTHRHSVRFMIMVAMTSIALMLSVAAYPQTCGSVLHHDTVLTSDIGPCPGDGLITAEPITVDLNGFTISGSANGTGIGINPQTQVTIVGPGTIANFHFGIRTSSSTPPANPTVIKGLSLTGNDVGVLVNPGSVFVRIIGNTITGGDIGIAVTESGAKIKDNVITNNSQDGIHIFDTGISLEIVSNTVNENDRGLSIDFGDPDFSNDPITVMCNDFSGNNGTGVAMRGSHITFETNTVQDNGGDGVVLSSHHSDVSVGNLLKDNVVGQNAGNGISLVNTDAPAPNQIVDNQLDGNGGIDLNWDGVGAASCWKLNDFATSNPATLPACP